MMEGLEGGDGESGTVNTSGRVNGEQNARNSLLIVGRGLLLMVVDWKGVRGKGELTTFAVA